jgi:hypothetical protein
MLTQCFLREVDRGMSIYSIYSIYPLTGGRWLAEQSLQGAEDLRTPLSAIARSAHTLVV